jgi:hypothetical protein
MTFGPHDIIAEEFANIPGAERIIIFGSWAARYTGHPGPPPNDIDVLVIGHTNRSDVFDAADRAQQTHRHPRQPRTRHPGTLGQPQRLAPHRRVEATPIRPRPPASGAGMTSWKPGHTTIATGDAANGDYLLEQARRRLAGARAANAADHIGTLSWPTTAYTGESSTSPTSPEAAATGAFGQA